MLIEYKNVNIYQQGKLVLEGVDFHVDEGEFIYIIGKVGSGKSSLLKTTYCELDLMKDEAEKAEVLGRNVVSLKRKEIPALRRELGIIFQDFQLLHDRTVYDNLEFVLKATGWKNKKDIKKRIDEVLADVGMQEKIHSMPHELSGGEQQRVSIARALAKRPRVLFLDEPTGALDEQTGRQVLDYICKLQKEYGFTIVMVTHNLNIAEMANTVIKMNSGKISEIYTNEAQKTAYEIGW